MGAEADQLVGEEAERLAGYRRYGAVDGTCAIALMTRRAGVKQCTPVFDVCVRTQLLDPLLLGRGLWRIGGLERAGSAERRPPDEHPKLPTQP